MMKNRLIVWLIATTLLIGVPSSVIAQTAYNLGQGVNAPNTWTALQTFSAGLTVSGGVLLAPVGSASTPSYSFSGMTGTGFWQRTNDAANAAAISVGGAVSVQFRQFITDLMGDNPRLATGSNTASLTIDSGSNGNNPIYLRTSGIPMLTVANLSIFGGGLAVNVVSKTAAYIAVDTDFVILANATSGPFTVTLPPATKKGQRIVVVKTDNSANAVTVSRAGTDTIEAVTTKTLASQYQKTEVIADGTATWYDLDTGLI